jgi:ELWxxDGT repeat protein
MIVKTDILFVSYRTIAVIVLVALIMMGCGSSGAGDSESDRLRTGQGAPAPCPDQSDLAMICLRGLTENGDSSSFVHRSAPVRFLNGFIYSELDFRRGHELFFFDLSTSAARLVKDINPGKAGSFPSSFIVVGSHIFFTAETTSSGIELWISDGTESGTRQISNYLGGDFLSPDSRLHRAGSNSITYTARCPDRSIDLCLYRTSANNRSVELVRRESEPIRNPEIYSLSSVGQTAFAAPIAGQEQESLFRLSEGEASVQDVWTPPSDQEFGTNSVQSWANDLLIQTQSTDGAHSNVYAWINDTVSLLLENSPRNSTQMIVQSSSVAWIKSGSRLLQLTKNQASVSAAEISHSITSFSLIRFGPEVFAWSRGQALHEFYLLTADGLGARFDISSAYGEPQSIGDQSALVWTKTVTISTPTGGQTDFEIHYQRTIRHPFRRVSTSEGEAWQASPKVMGQFDDGLFFTGIDRSSRNSLYSLDPITNRLEALKNFNLGQASGAASEFIQALGKIWKIELSNMRALGEESPSVSLPNVDFSRRENGQIHFIERNGKIYFLNQSSTKVTIVETDGVSGRKILEIDGQWVDTDEQTRVVILRNEGASHSQFVQFNLETGVTSVLQSTAPVNAVFVRKKGDYLLLRNSSQYQVWRARVGSSPAILASIVRSPNSSLGCFERSGPHFIVCQTFYATGLIELQMRNPENSIQNRIRIVSATQVEITPAEEGWYALFYQNEEKRLESLRVDEDRLMASFFDSEAKLLSLGNGKALLTLNPNFDAPRLLMVKNRQLNTLKYFEDLYRPKILEHRRLSDGSRLILVSQASWLNGQVKWFRLSPNESSLETLSFLNNFQPRLVTPVPFALTVLPERILLSANLESSNNSGGGFGQQIYELLLPQD